MSADRVLMELDDGVLTVRLNRPDKRNAMDTPMIDALHQALERAELDADARLVVLRGAGSDFCAGADLAELLASADQSPEENTANAHRLGDIFTKMRRLPKVAVAAVHGRALAGGCGLATACDIVIAHADASFGYPEVQRGFVPAMVLAMLRRAVGEKVAFDLVATGQILAAAEAARLGLISRAVPGSDFEQTVSQLSRKLARTSATALALTKQQLYELDSRGFEEAIALGARVNAVARSTPDFRAAIERFLKK